MKFKDLFKKVEIANEINSMAQIKDIVVELSYDNYKFYHFESYRQFKKVINEEFIPEIEKQLLEVDFEIAKDFVIVYKDWNNKDMAVKFCVEVI